MDLKEEHVLGDQVHSHWYYRAKQDALIRLVGDRPVTEILDIGAGSGYFSRALLARTGAARATCVDLGYPADRDEMAHGKPIAFRTSLDRSDADLVLMMDVIEHVADDVGLVADYVGKVPSGARFAVTVPAFMWLWSGHDVFLEHHRRYTLAGIARVLEQAGLRIEAGHYFYGALLPLVAAVRTAKSLGDAPPGSDLQRYSPLVNSLLYGVCRAEVAVMGLNRLGGTSVLVRAVKP